VLLLQQVLERRYRLVEKNTPVRVGRGGFRAPIPPAIVAGEQLHLRVVKPEVLDRRFSPEPVVTKRRNCADAMPH
jgi:hypothetical protein